MSPPWGGRKGGWWSSESDKSAGSGAPRGGRGSGGGKEAGGVESDLVGLQIWFVLEQGWLAKGFRQL